MNREETAYYTVQKGDSLYKIAKQFNTTVDKLIAWNGLQNNLILVGQTLQVNETLFPIPEHIGEDICDNIPSYQEEIEQQKYDTYTVQKGDSLYKIANTFHTDIATLSYINNLTNTLLIIGQILKIPKLSTTNNIYTIKKGDSLWKIANQYGVSIEAIKQINNLSSNQLNIGQTLEIPNIPPASKDVYIVKAGDSLFSIAQTYHTTVNDLIQKNHLSNTLLSIGQKLYL